MKLGDVPASMTPHAAAPSLRARMRACLQGLEPRQLQEPYNSEAAVLMPFFERDGEPHLLLTLRTQEVETHKGQISFPGGVREGAETLEQTALRETLEEVGIRPESIDLLGRFHDYVSVTDHRVTPFAGYLEYPFAAIPHASEVAEILHVPFAVFKDPQRLRVERRTLRGREFDVYFYSFGRHVIWGLTARIIRDFLRGLTTTTY